MKWVLDGSHIDGVRVFNSRKKAIEAAEYALKDIWTQPCIMQCGRTDGVEVVHGDDRTAYIWGDGFVAQVRKAF